MGISSDSTFPDRIPLCLADIRNLQNLSFLSIYTLLDISLTEKKLLGLECRYLQNNPALPGFITYASLMDSILTVVEEQYA